MKLPPSKQATRGFLVSYFLFWPERHGYRQLHRSLGRREGRGVITVFRYVDRGRPGEHGHESQVGPARRVGGEILDGRVGSRDPAILVLAEADGIVQVHLDQVLVEAVVAADPAAAAVEELAVRDVHVGADQAREGLTGCRLWVEEVRLALLGQLPVRGIPHDVAQARPLQHQRADGGDAVGRGTPRARGIEEDRVVGYAARRIKSDLEVVGQVLGLHDYPLRPRCIVQVLLEWSGQEIIG